MMSGKFVAFSATSAHAHEHMNTTSNMHNNNFFIVCSSLCENLVMVIMEVTYWNGEIVSIHILRVKQAVM